MNLNLYAEDHPPSITIESLIARHGAWRILTTVLAALVRRRKKLPDLWEAGISDHLRRDIGLWPEPKSPRHWDVRL